jgi:hypothetical protein
MKPSALIMRPSDDQLSGPVDNETCCMHEYCTSMASRFEEDPRHWHDWIWCALHAEGRDTEPLKLPKQGRREESDE